MPSPLTISVDNAEILAAIAASTTTTLEYLMTARDDLSREIRETREAFEALQGQLQAKDTAIAGLQSLVNGYAGSMTADEIAGVAAELDSIQKIGASDPVQLPEPTPVEPEQPTDGGQTPADPEPVTPPDSEGTPEPTPGQPVDPDVNSLPGGA